MSNQIQFNAFNFKSSQVRVITDPTGEFWFCANDVCAILDYANARQAVQKNCTPKGVSTRDTLTKGGKQEMLYINEPNLYRLIIKSRKPEAEPFEAWVFEEVLPQIRKTGKYESQPQQLALPAPMPEKTHTLTLTEQEIQHLVWVWFLALRCTSTLQDLHPILEQLRSGYAPTVYSQAYEYRHILQEAHELLERITDGFRLDHRTNWRVLQHLRNFDPTFKTRSF